MSELLVVGSGLLSIFGGVLLIGHEMALNVELGVFFLVLGIVLAACGMTSSTHD